VTPIWNAVIWGGISGATFGILRNFLPQTGEVLVALFAVIVLVMLPFSLMTTKVRLAKVR
jgi:hypothetical protein